ncbi:hypothetical protein L596_019257 [Steinernema carpocapsae]|uniref:AAA+ ATPase domain-containing protein n=1 Tax=Steinernema carpocapsae TaxID=34508 RepID=A0A4U5MPX1_STECR|nr:hypothetical protein L596_019257 [Steinernema carpocapsae]
MGKTGVIRDAKLESRISDVLNDQPKEGYDADEIAFILQQRFPEYSRRKKQVFVKQVEAIVNTQAGQQKSRKRKGDELSVSDLKVSVPDEIVLDDEMDTDDIEPNYPITNTANKSIRSLYAKGSQKIAQDAKNADGETKPLKKKKSALAAASGLQGPMKNRGLGSVPIISVDVAIPKIKFEDLGGCQSQFLEVCRLSMHLKHPELHEKLGVIPPTGILLHGPPGCGKSLFALAVSGELGIPLLKVATTELVSGVSGESEEKIRVLFQRAVEEAPCVLLLDEIDAIAPKRENATREMERRIVTQLLSSLDDLSSPIKEDDQAELRFDKDGSVSVAGKKSEDEEKEKKGKQYVLVIGTTNRPEAIETALRRAGRFDKEIALGIPDERARSEILDIVCRGLRVDESVAMNKIARLTPGYVGADLRALAREASMCAVNRIFETIVPSSTSAKRMTHEEICEELNRMVAWLNSDEILDSEKVENLFVTLADFERALTIVSPSAKREGFATVPDVTWDEIGALKEVRTELEWSILFPIKRPEDFAVLSISTRPQGILLCGPPGCGKTLLAKAVANETGMNFISVKGPELLSMYVGESERAVRTVFQRARDSSPCVIFFDEIDALCPKRSGNESTGGARLVNQLLTEMDGIEGRKQVYMIGATNRPDIVDPAILRPGRLDKILFVDFPNEEDRADIMRKSTKGGTKPRVSPEFSFEQFAARPELDYYTGADLAALIHEASVVALKERLSTENSNIDSLSTKHFEIAMSQIRPSVSAPDRTKYDKMKQMYTKTK